MDLYKLINGVPVKFKERYIKYDGMVYANPTEEQLKMAGWKELVVQDMPEPIDGYYLSAVYSETDTAIIQSWEQIEETDILDDIANEE